MPRRPCDLNTLAKRIHLAKVTLGALVGLVSGKSL
jgi:hypothetical protein